MTDAKYFLIVRFWAEPAAQGKVIAWLDGGHVDEVLRQPGFLWCRRLRIDGGGFAMMYGIASRAAFEAYEADAPLKSRFARERAPFEKHLRIERFSGELESLHAAA